MGSVPRDHQARHHAPAPIIGVSSGPPDTALRCGAPSTDKKQGHGRAQRPGERPTAAGTGARRGRPIHHTAAKTNPKDNSALKHRTWALSTAQIPDKDPQTFQHPHRDTNFFRSSCSLLRVEKTRLQKRVGGGDGAASVLGWGRPAPTPRLSLQLSSGTWAGSPCSF